MSILIVNCGSTSLKFHVMDAARSGHAPRIRLHGEVSDIGGRSRIVLVAEGARDKTVWKKIANHKAAAMSVLKWLDERGWLDKNRLKAVAFRIVHGGNSFFKATRINSKTLRTIKRVSSLAPLHNGPAIQTIEAVRAVCDPSIPLVAVFDTAYFREMPLAAAVYPIPMRLTMKHKLFRFGFHGLAHQSMVQSCVAHVSRPLNQLKLVTLQLGGGCSITATTGGKPVDTSMGLTPLEGLMMATRSGDINPELPGILARLEGVKPDMVHSWLNRESGLKGVSGVGSDMRILLAEEKRGNLRAALAVQMFCNRVRKHLGAYLAVLGGADAVVVGGGIGENSPEIRDRVFSGMEWCGIHLDRKKNSATIGQERFVSKRGSRVPVLVSIVDEAQLIFNETRRLLNRSRQRRNK